MSYNHHLDSYNGRRNKYGITNPLLRKIQKACRLSLREPDLSLNLEIADMINDKQGSYPRDACITLVKLINCRDLHTAIFAIALLDVIVKNCGYPVHLQISRKEFLNELVKRFPEQPPIRYSNVQKLILTAIEEWYQTFAKHGDYKKDMGYIRDMHRLLKFKGYSFPQIDNKDLAVLKPQKQLKTVKEYQREQDIKQAAKLEELIRRGSPEDLLEANKLMKVMAGFKQDNLIEARKLMNHELNKLRDKADLFNDLLNKSTNGSNNTQEQVEVMNKLFSILKTAQPKFIKIIEEEQEDDKLIQNVSSFNRYVEDLLNKYRLSKCEQTETTTVVNNSILSQEINLIDFDAEPSQSPSPSPEIRNDSISQQPDLLSDLLAQEDTSKPTSQDQIVDLLSDFNNLDLSNNVQTSKNFGMNGTIQLGATIPATPIVTNDTITGIIPESSNDILSLNEISSSSSSSSSSPEPFLSEQQTPSRILVNNSQNTQIDLIQTKLSNDSLKLIIMVSNHNNSPISNVTLSIAVPKTISLQLDTQSTTSIESNTVDGLTQTATLNNITNNGNKPLKIKWKLNYTTNDFSPIEQTAVFTLPSI